MGKNAKSATPVASAWLIAPQPHLGVIGLVSMLILSNALVPFSLDIYTPSVPELPAYFNTSEALVNLTLMGFFLFFAVGLLVFGPTSDRFGRNPCWCWGSHFIPREVPCARWRPPFTC